MKIWTIFAFVLVLQLGPLQVRSQTLDPGIGQLVEKQQADWNRNDMAGYASAFSEDAVLVNFLGMYWKGRKEIAAQFALINDCCIRPTAIALEWAGSKEFSADVVVGHLKETLIAREDYAVPGGVVKKGSVNHKYITAVFQKNQGQWKIASMQVTQVAAVGAPPK
ncbi:MAG: SgcJ/EcaC family oxidoreductase [Chitinophagaceae bacterium]|nr:MAG: SgcJ/EcaC family oxidoreductase [Chitinophagaceae bacterium]